MVARTTSWGAIARVVVLAALVYLALIAALRVLGARALAKMSAYDLVVTIALGSLIATIFEGLDVPAPTPEARPERHEQAAREGRSRGAATIAPGPSARTPPAHL